MSGLTADEQDRRQKELRNLLNQWDPIGVADIVNDEYDCLLVPLQQQLAATPSRAQIREYLWWQLEDHFGLDPALEDLDEIADRLLAVASRWNLFS